MTTKVKKQINDQPVEALPNSNDGSFNFDLWAREVRSQLVAALQKKSRRSADE